MSDINRRYFSSLLDVLRARGIEPRIATRKARDAYSVGDFQIIDSWPDKSIASAVKVLMPSKRITVDVTLKGKRANARFLILREDQDVIERIIGTNLTWNDEPPEERQIVLPVDADPTDESDWPRQHAIIATRLVGFRIAFEPRIERLP